MNDSCILFPFYNKEMEVFKTRVWWKEGKKIKWRDLCTSSLKEIKKSRYCLSVLMKSSIKSEGLKKKS